LQASRSEKAFAAWARSYRQWELPHASGAYAEILEDQKTVRYACEVETSMMLASFADCVRSDRMVEAFGPMGTREV
jgi:hypothetical protein